MKKLRLILGDQLNINHTWFKEIEPDTHYVMMEILPETQYVQHHVQKVVAFFLAMRHFADALQKRGFHVHYFQLDDVANAHSFEQNCLTLIQQFQFDTYANIGLNKRQR